MTTTPEAPDATRPRIDVRLRPVPGSKPWRAVILDGEREIPVGRFDTQNEAATTGVSALRFVNAGIAWRPVGVDQ